jgi:hypothetical protein
MGKLSPDFPHLPGGHIFFMPAVGGCRKKTNKRSNAVAPLFYSMGFARWILFTGLSLNTSLSDEFLFTALFIR